MQPTSLLPPHLRDKLGRAVAQGLQHGRGVGVEQRYPVGQFVVDLVLALRLQTSTRMIKTLLL